VAAYQRGVTALERTNCSIDAENPKTTPSKFFSLPAKPHRHVAIAKGQMLFQRGPNPSLLNMS
jgi:hypothetical protein